MSKTLAFALVGLVLVGLGREAAAADCKHEKQGLANAIKKRHAPMAQATATFIWAECERRVLDAMRWPKKFDLKKVQASIVARKKQLQAVFDAYNKAAATDAKDPHWKIMGAFGVARASATLAAQLRALQPPPFKGTADEKQAVVEAFKDAIENIATDIDAVAVKGFTDGLTAFKAAAATSDEDKAGAKDACAALKSMNTGFPDVCVSLAAPATSPR